MGTAGTRRKGRNGGAGPAASGPASKLPSSGAAHGQTDRHSGGERGGREETCRAKELRVAKASPPPVDGARRGQAGAGSLSVAGNQVRPPCSVQLRMDRGATVKVKRYKGKQSNY